MGKKRKTTTHTKICFIFIILIISLGFSSISYSQWSDDVEVHAYITSGCWDSCIRIRKTLEQGCPDICADCFYMTIEVMNNGSNDLTDVEITDTFGAMVTPIPGTININKGIASLTDKFLKWNIEILTVNEIVTLTICLSINYEDCTYIDALVVSPADNTDVDVPRYSDGAWGLTQYHVEHVDGSRIVRFESIGENLGEDGKVETDAFIIETLGGCLKVRSTNKAGQSSEYVTLCGVGDEQTDGNGFIIKLVSMDDIGGDIFRYNITVTSDAIPGGSEDPPGTASLSHIDFDFGQYCEIEINTGAKVTAKSAYCDLEATTISIKIRVDEEGIVISPLLPYSTPWAYQCCDI